MDTKFARANANEAAREFLERGWSVFPANPGEKEAKVEGWNRMILGTESVDEWFPPGQTLNIVRVNGANSNGAGDIDLDHPAALRVAQYLAPEELRRFGRDGMILGHIDVKFVDTIPRTTKFALPGEGDDRMIVELRADGSQTLMYGTYPNGDRLIWEEGEALEGHAVTIRALAEDIAVAALLSINYPGVGARHEFWLGAIGMLLKAKHPAERVRRIVEAVCRAANDPERESRLLQIDKTFSKLQLGERVAGKGKLEKVAPGVPQLLKEWLQIGSIAESGLPHIIVNERPLRDVSDEGTDALVAANDPPEIFARAGSLARMAQDHEGRPVIQEIDKDRLRYRMTRTAEYLKLGDNIVHVYPPDAVIGDVLAAKAFAFPKLVGITQSPVLRPSGTILHRPGYDPETGLFYVPEDYDIDVVVPFEPSDTEVQEAVSLLEEVYCDFPFDSDASRANMYGLTLTPIVRPAFRGPSQLAVINKPAAGTGGSLLSEVVCDIATARGAAMMPHSADEEECRKRITSVLRTGRPIIVIDNLTTELKQSALASALTAETWEDRILGHSKVVTLPQRSTWITSGNNVSIGGDMPRRCYHIRLDAKMEFPAERDPESFRHPDLRGWVKENRGRILSALLTIARNWFAQGQPAWTGPQPGSYEDWSRTVGGILQACGVEGFLGNQDDGRGRTTAGVSEWEAFLTTLHQTYGSSPWKAKALVSELEQNEELADALPAELAYIFTEGIMVSRKFGEVFAKKADVRHGKRGYRIVRCEQSESSKSAARWSVLVDEPPKGQKGQKGQPPPAPEKFGEKQQEVTDELQDDTKLQNFPGPGSGDPSDPSDPSQSVLSPGSDVGKGEVSNVVNLGRPRDYVLVETGDDITRLVRAITRNDILGVDLETTDRRWFIGAIRVISVTTPEGETFVVDVNHPNVDPTVIYAALTGKHIVCHNATFDAAFLLRVGCRPARLSCTMVLNQLRYAGLDHMRHGLASVVEAYTGVGLAKDVDHACWRRESLTEQELAYAADDSRYLLEVYDQLAEVLDEHVGMEEVADLEVRFTKVVAAMSEVGMPADLDLWGAAIDEKRGEKEELVELLDSYIGDVETPEKFLKANRGNSNIPSSRDNKVNWSSPDQKKWAIAEVLGLELPTRNKKKGGEWVQVETLDKDHIHLLKHPIGEALKEYQAIANFPATFESAVTGEDSRYHEGRIYPEWRQLRARTGRMSCTNPPMHNPPKKTAIREAIVAPDGKALISCDFSQIEPRVLAALSRDPALISIFKGGKDSYKNVAARALGKDEAEVTDEERKIFKTILLGLIYGMSVYGLTLRVHRDIDPGINVDQIEGYVDAVFAAFPAVDKWRSDLEAEFEAGSRETRTLLGRRRMKVENKRQRWNAPIQGTACDLFKLASVELAERMSDVGRFDIVALIHDEVVIEVEEDRAEEVLEWAKKVMQETAEMVINRALSKSLTIPVAIDGGYGKTLQEAKDAAG